jgi:hypothetical protein
MTTHAQALPAAGSPLRLVLRANAVVTLISGAALLIDAGPLAALTGGFSSLALGIIGALCVVAAALCWRASVGDALGKRIAWVVAIVDVDWVIASAVILFTGWLPLTDAGWWLVLAQALVVDVFAAAQLWLLWKRR